METMIDRFNNRDHRFLHLVADIMSAAAVIGLGFAGLIHWIG